jgi:TolB-like protein/DNA-binding winged helix-turn-helix (wHTH) protein/tetratricopeptide (TPR) repeat protein
MSASGQSQNPRFRLDLSSYLLLDGDLPVRLERQPMELLILLVERKGQLVTRDEIAARLWGDGVFVDVDRNINSIVRKLRNAFKDDPDHPAFVETVVRKGYRFIGPIEVSPQLSEAPAPPVSADATLPRSTSRRPGHVFWTLAVVGAAMVILIAGVSWHLLRSSGSRPDPIRSIAVLPLENDSGDAGQEYFADGMTQELTSEIAQSTGLRVISHTSVLQYKNVRTAPEIGKELHVDAVVEGSVQRSGERVRVTAQLIRTASDQVLWSNSYERDLRDILGLQRDIAGDIAVQVRIKLNEHRGPSPTIDPAAHDLYLQGLFHYEKTTESDLRTAIDDFQKAIDKDPNYAAAYAGMSQAYVVLGTFYWPAPLSMPKAKAAASKALELDPKLSQAHVSLGSVYYYYDWDWVAAEREAETAIRLNPSDAYAHDLLAGYYGTMGRFNDSMAELSRARELAPRAADILGDTVFWAFFSRNYDLAIENGKAAVATQPDNAFAQVFLGMAYAKKGEVTEALQHADLARQFDRGPLIASFRANVYALAGRRDEALAELHEVEKQRVEHYSCAYEVGTAYILLGQTDRGFDWLNNAYEGRSNCMILLKVDPRLDGVRTAAQYQKLLRNVGLAE